MEFCSEQNNHVNTLKLKKDSKIMPRKEMEHTEKVELLKNVAIIRSKPISLIDSALE